MKILNYVFVITLFIQTSCMDKNKFVVFDNTPHKQYMGLKEKVRDVQITFFKEEIKEQGYSSSEPVSFIQFPFNQRSNPIYNMFFRNIIPELREDVDVCFPPIQFVRRTFLTAKVVDGISFTFNKNGFLDNMSLFYNNQLISFVDIEYNQDNLVRKITNKQTASPWYDPSMTLKSDHYKNASSFTRVYEYDYKDSDSLFVVVERGYCPDAVSSHRSEFIRKYRFNEDHLDMISGSNNRLYCIYLDASNKVSKIELYNNGLKNRTALLKNNSVYSTMPNSEFSWGENDIEYDDKFHIIRHNNSYEKWDFKYDGESGLMTEIIHSIFDEKYVYNIAYDYDKYGNWTQMNITADRHGYDELEESLYDIRNKMKNIRKRMSYKEYYKGLPIDSYEFDDEYNNLKFEKDRKERIRESIKQQTSRYIIKRNILYY